jgi:hypothetical protein
MPHPPLWRIEYLREEDGSDPFPVFVSMLSVSAQIEWKSLIRLLEKRGDRLRGDRVSRHSNNLREFRGDEVLIFYKCAQAEREITVIGGMLPNQGREVFETICRKAERV